MLGLCLFGRGCALRRPVFVGVPLPISQTHAGVLLEGSLHMRMQESRLGQWMSLYSVANLAEGEGESERPNNPSTLDWCWGWLRRLHPTYTGVTIVTRW